MATVRCPMPECRKRIDLDDLEAIPAPPGQPAVLPCLHFIAAWGGQRGRMAEAVLFALEGNREFLLRNLRPAHVRPHRIEEERPRLDAVAHQFAHVVRPEGEPEEGAGVLFGDRHEANHVAREFAHYILGADSVLGGGRILMADPRFRNADETHLVEMLPGVRRRTLVSGDRETLVRFEIDTDAEVPLHTHPHEQAGTLISGRILLRIADEERELAPGAAWLIPGDIPHWAKALEPSVLVECFSPVREDYAG